tara:strand:+ start:271 stop:1596 length:1326 start_codon:yes stop_codon:yes gene_type:complete
VFYIAESEEQLTLLKNYGSKGGYVEVISSHDLYHPKLTTTVAVYIRPVDHKEGYIVPINHEEGLNITKERVSDILSAYRTLYVLDKKNALYHFNIQHAIDLSLLYSMVKYDRLEIPSKNNTVNWFYNKFSEFKNINHLIPISILHQKCDSNYLYLEKYFTLEIPSGFEYYNTTATNVFFLIEQTGLGIHYQAFKDLLSPRQPEYSIIDNVVLTSYNLYNATSRPTNSFNSVNFAAIPKTEEHRKCFKPQNDFFVEFDFDGYHLRLLCEQINFPLTSESAHKQLAKNYFGTEDITEEQYLEAKQINFQAIYGKIPDQHRNLEIFKLIQRYIDEMWEQYERTGVVFNPHSSKPFTKELKDMHPAKLMNYMMQSLETSRNILILKNVVRYLKDKKTKVALYTYDAILFDFSKEDGKNTLEDLRLILEETNKYPVKFKYSQSLVL